LLRAAGSAAVLFKESWRLAQKILFLVQTVIREILTLLAILHLEIAKNLFAAGSAEQLSSPLVYNGLTVLIFMSKIIKCSKTHLRASLIPKIFRG